MRAMVSPDSMHLAARMLSPNRWERPMRAHFHSVRFARRLEMRRPRLAFAALLLACGVAAEAQPFDGCPSAPIGAAFVDFGKTGSMPPALGRWLGDREAQRTRPFKVFDDAYFVGVCWVSAWLLPTPQGHFLIDTLHEP